MFKRSLCTITLLGLLSGSMQPTDPVKTNNTNNDVKYYLERAQDKLKQAEVEAQKAAVVETPMQQHVNKLKKSIEDKHVLNFICLGLAGIAAAGALIMLVTTPFADIKRLKLIPDETGWHGWCGGYSYKKNLSAQEVCDLMQPYVYAIGASAVVAAYNAYKLYFAQQEVNALDKIEKELAETKATV